MRKLFTILTVLIPLCTSFVHIPDEELQIRTLKRIEFSVGHLRTYLHLIKAPDANIMMAQFALETGWFKSRIFTDGNNICGMKLPRKRSTTATGEIYGYASYNHWTCSVDDFILYLSYHGISNGYIHHISSYAEDPSYYELIINIYKKLQDES